MRKNIILSQTIPATTIGIDLSDRTFQFCQLNAAGEIVEEGQASLTRAALGKFLASRPAGARVAFETGGHSAWVRGVVEQMGHEAVVANARELQPVIISSSALTCTAGTYKILYMPWYGP